MILPPPSPTVVPAFNTRPSSSYEGITERPTVKPTVSASASSMPLVSPSQNTAVFNWKSILASAVGCVLGLELGELAHTRLTPEAYRTNHRIWAFITEGLFQIILGIVATETIEYLLRKFHPGKRGKITKPG